MSLLDVKTVNTDKYMELAHVVARLQDVWRDEESHC